MLKKLSFYINHIRSIKPHIINDINNILTDIKSEPLLYSLDLTKPFVIHLLDLKGNIIYYSTCTLSKSPITGISCYMTLENLYPYLCYKIELASKDDKYCLSDAYYTGVIIYISEKYTPELNLTELFSLTDAAFDELSKINNDLNMQKSLK